MCVCVCVCVCEGNWKGDGLKGHEGTDMYMCVCVCVCAQVYKCGRTVVVQVSYQ